MRVVATIDIGSSVRDVALSPDGAIAYVASCGSDFGAVVDVIDTRTHQITSSRAISEIGGLVTRVSVSGDADRAYLVSEDRVTVLCTRTHDVIGTIRTGQPSCVVEPGRKVPVHRRLLRHHHQDSGCLDHRVRDRAAGATAPRVYAVVLA